MKANRGNSSKNYKIISSLLEQASFSSDHSKSPPGKPGEKRKGSAKPTNGTQKQVLAEQKVVKSRK